MTVELGIYLKGLSFKHNIQDIPHNYIIQQRKILYNKNVIIDCDTNFSLMTEIFSAILYVCFMVIHQAINSMIHIHTFISAFFAFKTWIQMFYFYRIT